MSTYATVVTLGDFGPWISKIVVDLPVEVRASEVSPATFNVYCARFEPTGEPLMRKERGADHAVHTAGYVPVLAAYPCDERGCAAAAGTHVALETPEVRLTKRVEGRYGFALRGEPHSRDAAGPGLRWGRPRVRPCL